MLFVVKTKSVLSDDEGSGRKIESVPKPEIFICGFSVIVMLSLPLSDENGMILNFVPG